MTPIEQFITDPITKTRIPGALSRVATKLGISINAVKRFVSGEWVPCPRTARRIQDMIHSRMPLHDKRRDNKGRPRKKKTGIGKEEKVF